MLQGKKPSILISNTLVRAAYTLSLSEKRLVMFAVSNLDTESANRLVTFSCLDYLRFYKLSEKGSGRRDIKSALDRLWNRVLSTPDGAEHRWIISRGKYAGSDITIRFHPDLEEHLFNLQKHFTKYILERASDFKLFYTWRLFELIMQFKKTGMLRIDVDEFKKILELPEYYNKDFARISNKVIKPAIKEIKEKDGLDIKYSIKKTGRKVTGLTFTFPVEQQKTIPANQQPKPISKAKKIKDTKQENHLAILSEIEGARQMAKLTGDSIESLLTEKQLEVYQQQNA